jgi:hypothetical protein
MQLITHEPRVRYSSYRVHRISYQPFFSEHLWIKFLLHTCSDCDRTITLTIPMTKISFHSLPVATAVTWYICLTQPDIIYLFMVYLIMLSAALMRTVRWLLKCYGHGRKLSRPNLRYCTILTFGWRKWVKPEQDVRIVLKKSEMGTSQIQVRSTTARGNLLTKGPELWCHTQDSFCVRYCIALTPPTLHKHK